MKPNVISFNLYSVQSLNVGWVAFYWSQLLIFILEVFLEAQMKTTAILLSSLTALLENCSK